MKNLLSVLRIGAEVKNPVFWKLIQVVGTVVFAIASVVTVSQNGICFNFHLSESESQLIGYAVTGFVGLANIIISVVTTKKVGLPAKKPA